MDFTTPAERVGPGPPYSTPGMHANLFFRVFLGALALLSCWVPMRLLWRNGELAATIFCVDVMILNLYYVVNALIWRDDNVKSWYAGYGWCDLQAYTILPLETLYAACIFAIVRNLANKVGLMRVTSLSASEKKRHNIVECLIMFPIPLFQVVFTYFILAQRYNVATLVGCGAIYDTSWPLIIVYLFPTTLLTIGAAVFAVHASALTWKRFREVAKSTRAAMNSNNSLTTNRHRRLKRKLYLLTLTILIPFLPIQILWLIYDLVNMHFPLQGYNFHRIHYGMDPSPYSFVSFVTYHEVPFVDMNSNYIAAITAVPIFWFFGATKEAINTYRTCLLAAGLGRFFPRLLKEYDPDQSSGSRKTWSQSLSKFFRPVTESGQRRGSKDPILPTVQHVSMASTTSTVTRKPSSTPAGDVNLWPEPTFETGESSSAAVPAASVSNRQDDVHIPHRNPFVFRTALSAPLTLLRAVSLPGFRGERYTAAARTVGKPAGDDAVRDVPMRSLSQRSMIRRISVDDTPATSATAAWGHNLGGVNINTQVWSEEQPYQREPSLIAKGSHAGGVKVETRIASSAERYEARQNMEAVL
ncbi:hypothetical protein VTK73DRAFT_8699 [Phialemonium thermophilum]|uniref:Pheromone receptor n=1 Tax=Phialemonium thermophilum TaxID=223376 RepID=A0ABR3W6S8_9PEZI